MPANVEMESRRKQLESTLTIPAFHTIPAEIPPAIVSVPTVTKPFIQPVSVPLEPNVSVSIPAPQKAMAQTTPPQIKKKFVTREDLATIFRRGERGLTRAAVAAALKKIGFGKSAAYAALSENGRFSAWLRFAPDGIIS